MPIRPKKPCRHPGCPNLTDERYCSEHSVDNKRASANERGYTSKWRRLSKLYIKAHPLCVECKRHGRLTPATELEVAYREIKPGFNSGIYQGQVFDNYGNAEENLEPVMGPNIADWPAMQPLTEHLLLRIAGSYSGSITTDELIPSGEASSFRSNPERIAGYTLINRDPGYLFRAKAVRTAETARHSCGAAEDAELDRILSALASRLGCTAADVTLGSAISADQIGDGSSREQAVSCQRVLGGFANIAREYATKRYRSNCINWGILPLRTEQDPAIPVDSLVLVKNIRTVLKTGERRVLLEILDAQGKPADTLEASLDQLTKEEADILLSGCLINYYRR